MRVNRVWLIEPKPVRLTIRHGRPRSLIRSPNVPCLSQRHKNAADAFHQRIILVHGKGLVGVEDRFNLDGLLRDSRCFEWGHGWRKAIETAHVHVLVRRE